MKILMVSLTSCPIPSPKDQIFAPGIICYDIAKGLKQRGHKIKVFAADDSRKDEIDIEGCGIKSTYSQKNLSPDVKSYRIRAHELFTISAAFEEFKKGKYDLLHLNSFPVSDHFTNLVDGPITCTHHGSPSKEHDLKTDIDRIRQKKYYDRIKFIAISNKQRQLGKDFFNYIATIHHGINLNSFKFNPKPSGDLAFVGRILEMKGPDIAIKVAIKTKRKINIVGDHSDEAYWQKIISPLVENNKNVTYHGHVAFDKIGEAYGQAKALLVPISWDEPFGMVVIEAMACGTPVIAFNRGSMADLIVDGVNGFLIKPGDFDGFVEATKKIDQIDRKKCREHVEKNFSIEKMVDEYEKLFLKVIKNEGIFQVK